MVQYQVIPRGMRRSWSDRGVIVWRVHKMEKSDYELRHVYPSVRVKQLGSHWKDFREI